MKALVAMVFPVRHDPSSTRDFFCGGDWREGDCGLRGTSLSWKAEEVFPCERPAAVAQALVEGVEPGEYDITTGAGAEIVLEDIETTFRLGCVQH